MRFPSSRRLPLALTLCMLAAAGHAQPVIAPALPASAPSTAPAECPAPADVTQAQMLGLWRAEFQGLWQGATLLIEKHPVHGESLSGAINRDGARSQLAGDLDQGELTLEESADGVRIAATWLGDVVEGSCGREIRGTWQATGESTVRGFVLRKQLQAR